MDFLPEPPATNLPPVTFLIKKVFSIFFLQSMTLLYDFVLTFCVDMCLPRTAYLISDGSLQQQDVLTRLFNKNFQQEL